MTVSSENLKSILETLKKRFEENLHRHPKLNWLEVQEKLEQNPQKLLVLVTMEETGGEPDVVDYDAEKQEFIFMDCSKESPIYRRSFCYDKQALDKRKEHKPSNNVLDFAKSIGIKLLNEQDYRFLQSIEKFDTKTSSWIETPEEIRSLGGALFADFRYNTVFIYHNGAESYYAARGFRGLLRV